MNPHRDNVTYLDTHCDHAFLHGGAMDIAKTIGQNNAMTLMKTLWAMNIP